METSRPPPSGPPLRSKITIDIKILASGPEPGRGRKVLRPKIRFVFSKIVAAGLKEENAGLERRQFTGMNLGRLATLASHISLPLGDA